MSWIWTYFLIIRLLLIFCKFNGGFPGGSVVKNLPAKQEMQVRSLDQKDPLEKAVAAHCSILAWEIPWTGAWLATVHGVTKSQTWLSD